jgi:hypothetical protein
MARRVSLTLAKNSFAVFSLVAFSSALSLTVGAMSVRKVYGYISNLVIAYLGG